MLTLKQFRRKHNLTQKKLADKVGVTPATLSRYENGEWHINQAVIDKIEAEYGEAIRPVRHKGMKKKKVWMKSASG